MRESHGLARALTTEGRTTSTAMMFAVGHGEGCTTACADIRVGPIWWLNDKRQYPIRLMSAWRGCHEREQDSGRLDDYRFALDESRTNVNVVFGRELKAFVQ